MIKKATRLTKQRALILEELCKLTSHPTADDIYDTVRAKLPKISLGTVYRNLDFLADHKQILKLEYAGFKKRFDGKLIPHTHIRCECCGKVADVTHEALEPSIPKNIFIPYFKITSARLEFFGLCDNCKTAQEL